jgi:predicted membrane-bound dolichyl-phosphate-mannose-protein mannosyltransferase
VVALGIRIAAAFWYDAHTALWGDAYWYSGVAKLIAAGRGFVNPAGRIAFHHDYATAAHPPLYPLFLSLVAHVDTSLLAQRLWSCVPGTGTVILLGLLTRDLAGERAGLIAAGLGAVFVELFAQDVLVMSEGLFGFTIVLTVLLSYRFLRQPNLLRAGLLAGAIALASLTRAEGALLFVILLVPLALRAKELELPRRLACICVGALVAIVVFAPGSSTTGTGSTTRFCCRTGSAGWSARATATRPMAGPRSAGGGSSARRASPSPCRTTSHTRTGSS